jgi:hypothetical protein
MKTLVISVEELSSKPKGYPVRLYMDDGQAGWLQKNRALASSIIRPDLSIPSPPLDPVDDKTPLEGEKLREMFLEEDGSSERFEAIGKYLYQLLFQGKVKEKWDELCQQYPKERPQQPGPTEGRRTILDIKPKTLRMLPWELMSPTSSPLPLFTDTLNPIVRGALNVAAPSASYMWPLHVLIVIGAKAVEAGDVDDIKAEEEVMAIEDALIKFGRPVEWEVLRRPSNQKLTDTLRTFRPHVFHFIGHGKRASGGRVPVLEFEAGDEGQAWEWPARRISIDLNDVWVPRFAFINACRSSDQDEQEKVWGITDAFIEAGVPAVIGMQADVQGNAAANFPGRLYEAMARNIPLDVALAQARTDVMNVEVDGLERRDWALATFTLSVLPEQVIPMQPPVTTEFKLDIESRFSDISDFVDRVKPRRALWYGIEPVANPDEGKNLLMVKGSTAAGKTWLVHWCLKICAWRERNIMYVSLKEQGTKDFLQVLRLIRKACVTGEPFGRPVGAEAFHQFNQVVNHILDPAQPTPGAAGAPVDDLELPLKPDIDNDSLELILASFKSALQKAASNKLLVIALDDLKIRKDHFKNYLIPHLIKPIAAGQEETLKNIRMILVATNEEYDNEFELGNLESLSITVRLDLLSKSELSYFSRELCVLKGLTHDKATAFSSFVSNANGPTVKPDDIRQMLRYWLSMNH